MENVDKNIAPETAPEDVRIMQLGGTTFEVVYNYVGEKSLLDVVKYAIKRDIEIGL